MEKGSRGAARGNTPLAARLPATMSRVYRDGCRVLREQLEDRRRQRVALLEGRDGLDAELAVLDGEIAELEVRVETGEAPQAARFRWLWPLVGAATAAAGAYSASITLVTSYGRRPKVDSAQIGAGVIRQAAELYANMDDDAGRCPTLNDLVAAKRVDRHKTSDPWGQPYRVECIGDDVHVWSAGKDGVHRSPDDIADDFKASDVKRVAEL